jgi:hypothetical protein
MCSTLRVRWLYVCPTASSRTAHMSAHRSFPPAATTFLSSVPATPSRSPLYRDALTSVLAFRTLPELAAALAVNKE